MRTQHTVLLWLCNPFHQLERCWLNHLLNYPSEIHIDRPEELHLSSLTAQYKKVFVVVSALHTLRGTPTSIDLCDHAVRQSHILNQLLNDADMTLLHLSDEEGMDGEHLYQLLPSDLPIWRNFAIPKLTKLPNVKNFPIGPRGEFLSSPSLHLDATERRLPCFFSGRLWPNGSRESAIKLFQEYLPDGFYLSTKGFAQGLPLNQYAERMRDSIFALAPPGDRHLDTFRLWEALQAGCIPLLVDQDLQSYELLMPPHPIPIFRSWYEARDFSGQLLNNPSELKTCQRRVFSWWSRYTETLRDMLIGNR